jgi:GrpB-like predicted nucleotidyltransferase (UPF0157 family)
MIQIVEHQRSWSIEFQEISTLLKSSLGSLAIGVDHIGSTAIPGLCAKDILDVQVSVSELTPKIIAAMNEIGFGKHPDVNSDHIPPGFIGEESAWSKYFFMQPVGQRRVNVHVRKVGNPNQRYAILFRDYLIANRSASLAYGELKRRLAISLKNDADYPQVKDPAVDLIYYAAEKWALYSGWNINEEDA